MPKASGMPAMTERTDANHANPLASAAPVNCRATIAEWKENSAQYAKYAYGANVHDSSTYTARREWNAAACPQAPAVRSINAKRGTCPFAGIGSSGECE